MELRSESSVENPLSIAFPPSNSMKQTPERLIDEFRCVGAEFASQRSERNGSDCSVWCVDESDQNRQKKSQRTKCDLLSHMLCKSASLPDLLRSLPLHDPIVPEPSRWQPANHGYRSQVGCGHPIDFDKRDGSDRRISQKAESALR